MQYLIRWLVISGGAATLVRAAGGPLRRTEDGRVLRGGALLLLVSWILTIADAFLPVMTLPPLGLLAFLFCTVVSITTAIASAVLAGIVVLRRTGKVPAPAGSARVGFGLPALLIVAAAISVLGERILSIVAAVHT